MKYGMKYRLFTLLSLITFHLSAQTSLSLEDAIFNGLKNNYSVISILKKQNIAGINNSWGKAGALPSISFRGSLDYSKETINNTDDNGKEISTGVYLNCTLFNGFRVKISKRKLEAYDELSKGNTGLVIENTIQAIILAYYKVLIEKEKYEISKQLYEISNDNMKHLAVYRKSLHKLERLIGVNNKKQKLISLLSPKSNEWTKKRKDLGSMGVYNLLQAENSFLEDKSKMLIQGSVYKNSMRILNLLMANDSEQMFELKSHLNVIINNYSLSQLIDKMLSSNPVLKNQYISQRIKEMNIQLAKSSYYPSLSFNTNYSYLNLKEAYIKNSASIGLNLSYSLFSGGSKKRALRIANIYKEIGDIDQEDMILKMSNKLAVSLEVYNLRKATYKIAEENLKKTTLNLEISHKRFEMGDINAFNYRDVQLMYLRAAEARLHSVYNLIEANTILVKLTGGLISE